MSSHRHPVNVFDRGSTPDSAEIHGEKKNVTARSSERQIRSTTSTGFLGFHGPQMSRIRMDHLMR
jgi:hypothetical protein